jgi:hypothetical protein
MSIGRITSAVVTTVTRQGKVNMGSGRARVETIKFYAMLGVGATKTEAAMRARVPDS